MARPKTIRDGTKLNLYVPRSIKRHLHRLATANRRSISAMVTELALAAPVPSGQAATKPETVSA